MHILILSLDFMFVFNIFLFRFPITDLRTAYDRDRVPWWQQNVRSDYLLIKLIQTKMSYSPYHRYEIEANEINLYYCVRTLVYI